MSRAFLTPLPAISPLIYISLTGAVLWFLSGKLGILTWKEEEDEQEGGLALVGNYLHTPTTLRITGFYLLHPELSLFKWKRQVSATGATNTWHYFMPFYHLNQVCMQGSGVSLLTYRVD